MMNHLFKDNNEIEKPRLLTQKFYELEQLDQSPFHLALTSYKTLKEQSKSSEELFDYLIEDSMFSSIYATYFEHLLSTLNKHPQHALALIEKFAEDADKREQIISTQAQNHFTFIENFGMCDGCTSCDNHSDVSQLINPFQKGDINFFTELYIGMQTIQFSLEYLTYDLITQDSSIIGELTLENILNLRQTIYGYAQIRAEET